MKPKPESIVLIVTGIVILAFPDLFRVVVGVSLIVVGVLGALGGKR